ncbi:radical SAM protein [Persephonella sp.]
MKVKDIVKDQLNNLFEIETEDSHTIEAVHYRGDTLCVSTQLGCPIRCSFCASGLNGLIRNLSYEEIIGQYFQVENKGFQIKNIAFAGIGEPLLNWDNVKKAFFFFKDKGLKVSFYTTGFPLKNFKELLELPHNGVTVSIHSVNEDKRSQLIPVNHSLMEIIQTLKTHLNSLSNKKKKLYSIGYLLIDGVNNSDDELKKLSEIAENLNITVSLLKFNEIEGIEYKSTSDDEYERAFLFLRKNGIKVTLSNRYRTRKIGGCGTLMVNRIKEKTQKQTI